MIQPTTAVEVALAYIDRLSNLDVDGIIELLASHAVQESPFSADTPTQVGIEDLSAHYRLFPDSFSSVEFVVTSVWPHADPQWVTVEYEGRIIAQSGDSFENWYLCMFRVVEGRIEMIREFFVPVVPESYFEG